MVNEPCFIYLLPQLLLGSELPSIPVG